MLTLPLTRHLLIATATLALPGGADPRAPLAGANDRAAPSLLEHRARTTMTLHGRSFTAPPGVQLLGPDTLLIGGELVTVPPDVFVEFTPEGDAIFELSKDVPPRSWVLTVGKKKLVASAGARAVVPWPGNGVIRVEWSRFSYQVPAARDALGTARDLKDPLDASPYR
ncbi:MAG: hypothetical protein FJ293_16370 [Planctomycetes bacterium]|nr:hypothetical protein [Planctomycetota bacterium]